MGLEWGVGGDGAGVGLSRSLAGAGLRVDHFREGEILTRPEIAAVAEEFGATGAVGLGTLVAATARFVGSVVAHGDDVVIADALVPFVPTLLAPVRPTVVFLDGDAGPRCLGPGSGRGLSGSTGTSESSPPTRCARPWPTSRQR